MSDLARPRHAKLAKMLWLVCSNVILIYSLAAPNSRQLYARLALTALAIVMLSIRLDARTAALMTAISTSLGLAYLNWQPILPHVNKKAYPAFIKAFRAYQMNLTRYSCLLIAGAALLAYLLAYSCHKVKHIPKLAEVQPQANKLRFSTFDLTSIAVFVAFGVVINTVRAGYFSFGGLPIILAGFSLGPVHGFIAGMLTDLVGFIIRPGGQFSPIYVITSALTGFIPAFIVQYIWQLKNKTKHQTVDFKDCNYWQMFLAIAIGQFITSVLIVSISRSLLYGQGTFIYFFLRTLSRQVFNVPLYAYLSLGILRNVNLANLRQRKRKHT